MLPQRIWSGANSGKYCLNINNAYNLVAIIICNYVVKNVGSDPLSFNKPPSNTIARKIGATFKKQITFFT